MFIAPWQNNKIKNKSQKLLQKLQPLKGKQKNYQSFFTQKLKKN